MEKLRSIQEKKEEAIAKLQAISTIEKDIRREEQEKSLRVTKKVGNYDNDKENKQIEKPKNSRSK